MKSILQDKKICFICGATSMLDEHHIMNGYGLKRKCDADGLKIFLCRFCHESVHRNSEQRYFLKKIGERKYLEEHSYEEYMKRYKKNYLEEDELNQIIISKIERKIRDAKRKDR